MAKKNRQKTLKNQNINGVFETEKVQLGRKLVELAKQKKQAKNDGFELKKSLIPKGITEKFDV